MDPIRETINYATILIEDIEPQMVTDQDGNQFAPIKFYRHELDELRKLRDMLEDVCDD